jgi:DNA-binding NtrC family response regulator
VPVNCGAISASLLESQLFGHVKGSFTGAGRDEPGFVRASDGGTLFLDEIGDLPLAAQAALLRVIQEREVVPVGSTRAVKVDLRVLAATHRRIDHLAVRGEFRSDLYARLAGHVHHLAPLRDRREDIGIIIASLLERAAPGSAAELRLSPEAGRALLRHDWPLNVRELEQALARALVLAEDGVVRSVHLARPPDGADPPAADADDEAPPGVNEAEVEATLRRLLERHHGNVSEVARAMGKGRMQIHRWLKRYGIDAERFRG